MQKAYVDPKSIPKPPSRDVILRELVSGLGAEDDEDEEIIQHDQEHEPAFIGKPINRNARMYALALMESICYSISAAKLWRKIVESALI